MTDPLEVLINPNDLFILLPFDTVRSVPLKIVGLHPGSRRIALSRQDEVWIIDLDVGQEALRQRRTREAEAEAEKIRARENITYLTEKVKDLLRENDHLIERVKRWRMKARETRR